MNTHQRSFRDALRLVRNIHDRGTIYYNADGNRAVYDVSAQKQGEMYVNGRMLTIADAPSDIAVVDQETYGSTLLARNAIAAENMFRQQEIKLDIG